MTDKVNTSPREQLLDTAKSLISGRRADEYGDAYENFSAIADMWTSYLNKKQSHVLSAHDVAAFMIMVKLARIAGNPRSWDSWVDIAGYTALGAETVKEND